MATIQEVETDSDDFLTLFYEQVLALRGANVDVIRIVKDLPVFETDDVMGTGGLMLRFSNPRGIEAKHPGSMGQYDILLDLPTDLYPEITALSPELRDEIIVTVDALKLEI